MLFRGAAKHQNRSLFEESMTLCIRVLWYLMITIKNGPQKSEPLDGRHIVLKYGHENYHILAHICSSIAPRTKIEVSTRTGYVFDVWEHFRTVIIYIRGVHIGFQDAHHMFYITSRLTCYSIDEKNQYSIPMFSIAFNIFICKNRQCRAATLKFKTAATLLDIHYLITILALT